MGSNMLGLRKTAEAIKNANGPAQHIMYSVWGFIIAGMYVDMGVSNYILLAWVSCSLLTAGAVVWLSKNFLKRILLADVLLSALVLGLYISETTFGGHSGVDPIYYVNTINGMEPAMKNTMGHTVDSLGSLSNFISHILPCLVLIFHGIYLANLVERQELERKRFNDGKL